MLPRYIKSLDRFNEIGRKFSFSKEEIQEIVSGNN